MKRRLALALTLAACLAAARPVAADDYTLDEAHASVFFAVSHAGMSYTYGRFNVIKGAYTLDADPTKCAFKVSIQTDSVDTNNGGRDRHLRSPDFFNAEEFPVISFESTKVAARQVDGKTVYDVTGAMTMHGVTKEITLPLKKLGEGQGGRDYRSGFLCETTLKRSDYGMTNNIPAIGDEVEIKISFEGVRK
jgi:polyisoprenoid-binding protein YceI